MRRSLVIGNWKMHGNLPDIALLLAAIKSHDLPNNVQCIVLPPVIYLSSVRAQLSNSSILFGAQNVYPETKGAYTGEISGPMLHEYGCSYVLVGHSERRQLFHESEKFIAEKFHHVKLHGMIPVLCVGETSDERNLGQTEAVILRQLQLLLQVDPDVFANSVIAYEPVWAIGTGKVASPEEVQQVHAFIRNTIAAVSSASASLLPILYGGSVNANNASALFAMPDVDGGLVGGASLNAQQFVEIVKCIN